MSKIENIFRRSIRWRFTGIFIALIAGLLLILIAVNSFFLEPYYTRDKIRVLESAHDTLDQMIQRASAYGEDASALLPDNYNPTDPKTETPATRYIRSLNETYNINIVLVNTKTDKIFTTSGDWRFQILKLNQRILGNALPFKTEVVRSFDDYTIEQTQERRSSSVYLESWGYFSDDTTSFIMSMPISSIQEAVGFFNQFLLIIGMAVLALGTGIVYLASREIAKPINALARLSEKMLDLDFTARYRGRSADEIGVLGKSMNKLSDTLEHTIAELKTANNELQTDIENKNMLDKRRQEFVANVSHELKTPIALIQGYAEGLQDGMAEDPESRDYYCSVIVDEAGKMNRMVRQLMNLSSLEQGMDLPAIELFDLSTLISGVVLSADILVKQKDAQVEVEVPEPCMVWADEFKIEEVVTNYLNNALNHLEAPGKIRIYAEKLAVGEKLPGQPGQGDPVLRDGAALSAGEQQSGAVLRDSEMQPDGVQQGVHAHQKEAAQPADAQQAGSALRNSAAQGETAGGRVTTGKLVLHVMNTGKHIPEEDLDLIWEKFFKVDKAHTRAYGGTGLGLSIVKAIADAHHQRCGVRNVEGGVDFWFSLDAE